MSSNTLEGNIEKARVESTGRGQKRPNPFNNNFNPSFLLSYPFCS
jgi:hypothetical protein